GSRSEPSSSIGSAITNSARVGALRARMGGASSDAQPAWRKRNQPAGCPPCDRQSALRMKRVVLPIVHATAGLLPPSSDTGPESAFAFAHHPSPPGGAAGFAVFAAGAAAGFLGEVSSR